MVSRPARMSNYFTSDADDDKDETLADHQQELDTFVSDLGISSEEMEEMTFSDDEGVDQVTFSADDEECGEEGWGSGGGMVSGLAVSMDLVCPIGDDANAHVDLGRSEEAKALQRAIFLSSEDASAAAPADVAETCANAGGATAPETTKNQERDQQVQAPIRRVRRKIVPGVASCQTCGSTTHARSTHRDCPGPSTPTRSCKFCGSSTHMRRDHYDCPWSAPRECPPEPRPPRTGAEALRSAQYQANVVEAERVVTVLALNVPVDHGMLDKARAELRRVTDIRDRRVMDNRVSNEPSNTRRALAIAAFSCVAIAFTRLACVFCSLYTKKCGFAVLPVCRQCRSLYTRKYGLPVFACL